jgi:hypothetical protein
LLTNPGRPWKKAAFSQFLREGIWIAPDGIEYMGYAMRTERYRYVKWIRWATGEFAAQELYDHQTDPDENVNLVSDPAYQSLLQELDEQLNAGWQAAKPARFN